SPVYAKMSVYNTVQKPDQIRPTRRTLLLSLPSSEKQENEDHAAGPLCCSISYTQNSCLVLSPSQTWVLEFRPRGDKENEERCGVHTNPPAMAFQCHQEFFDVMAYLNIQIWFPHAQLVSRLSPLSHFLAVFTISIATFFHVACPTCLPALLSYGSPPCLLTSKWLAEQEMGDNGAHMCRDCIATNRTTGYNALENFLKDEYEGKAL
ncbi:hypothetical protein STEG23_038067, partial [Scotinomys teguina]